MTIDQFSGVVGNIIACNNLNFCDDELPDVGRNHNLALHITMNCKEDALSNVMFDNGFDLNVMPNELCQSILIMELTCIIVVLW